MQYFPRILSFGLSPSGRLGRRGFAFGMIAVLFLIGLLTYVLTIEAAFRPVVAIIGLVLWFKCALTSRRLHDIGATGWLLVPGVILILEITLDGFIPVPMRHFYNHLPIPHSPDDIYNYFIFIFSLMLIGDLILCFIPGNKTANRFGPPPGQFAAPAQDVF